MEPLLTLVIAIGGVATGIGAIWTAVVARRQAQLTEQSLTEQRQYLHEQNERTRLSQEMDMINRLEDRYYIQLADSRRRAAKYIKDNFFANDGSMLEVQNMVRNGEVILDYFEGLANLWRLGVLQDESVRYRFGMEAQRYWTLYKTAIKKAREEWKRPAVYEDLEQLARLMDNVDHQHGDPTEETSKEELRQFVEGEALVGVDPPTRE